MGESGGEEGSVVGERCLLQMSAKGLETALSQSSGFQLQNAGESLELFSHVEIIEDVMELILQDITLRRSDEAGDVPAQRGQGGEELLTLVLGSPDVRRDPGSELPLLRLLPGQVLLIRLLIDTQILLPVVRPELGRKMIRSFLAEKSADTGETLLLKQ